MTMRRPALGTVLGATALAVALASSGGVAEAAKLINGKLIKPNTVTTKQIKDGTIAPADLSAAAKVAGAPGAPGTSLASAMVSADAQTVTKARVKGVTVNSSSAYRVTASKFGTGRYCVGVDKNVGTAASPTWQPLATDVDHVALAMADNVAATATTDSLADCGGDFFIAFVGTDNLFKNAAFAVAIF